jgi:tRNA-2-methylthio-N6-dimethylallyladenosine synthase
VDKRKIKTYHISTYGCQMNSADSSTLVATMASRGYQRVEDEAQADLFVFNTCSVREKAEQRVIGRLGQIKKYVKRKPHVKVAVVGCMAQRLGEELIKIAPHVNIVLGTDRLFELPDVLEGTENTTPVMTAFGHEDMDLIEPIKETPFSGFVTISRGCDNYCTYCIVPYVRGRERAHSSEQIINNVNRLIDDGVIEITLLGQNVNSYKYNDTDFPDLLKLVLKKTKVPRLRFMTSHPKDLSDKLIDVLANEPRMMPHIHLPLQSGANRILKRMGRVYKVEHYLKIVESLRQKMDYLTITTDLIVGFPTEKEEEFEQTLDIVRQVQYDSAFMFRYSVRPGTTASRYLDDVPEEDKIRRLNKLIAVQQEIATARNQREIGQVRFCMVEGNSRRSEDFMRARSEGNKTVLFKANNINNGEIVPLRITSADAFTLHGKLEEEI